jgi:hypothetical protein
LTGKYYCQGNIIAREVLITGAVLSLGQYFLHDSIICRVLSLQGKYYCKGSIIARKVLITGAVLLLSIVLN